VENTEIISKEDMREGVSRRLITLIGSLAAISIFLNSIGFNLMAINAALTDYIVASIEYKKVEPVIDSKLLERILIMEIQIIKLKENSHPSTTKKEDHSQ